MAKLPVVDRITHKVASMLSRMENKVIGDSKLMAALNVQLESAVHSLKKEHQFVIASNFGLFSCY